MLKKWKQIPGYSLYIISNYGEVYSTLSNRLLTPRANENGYLRIQLTNDEGKRKVEFVHKLVLLTFIGPRPEGMVCRHYPDQNPGNCRLDNLSYCTQSQNQYDKIENHTNVSTKLTPELVIQIKKLLLENKSSTQIRKELNIEISDGVLSNIRHNNIWQNIGPDISNHEYRRGGGQKLSIQQVREIKHLLKTTNLSIYDIADRYDVTWGAIYGIKTNKYYKDV